MNISTVVKKVEEELRIDIEEYSILGEGQCNVIYKLKVGERFLCLKLEKEEKPFDELNHISVEGNVLKYLNEGIDISALVPELLVVGTNYYVYEYIDGVSMRDTFESFNKDAQDCICRDIARFHYLLGKAKKEDVLEIGITEYDPTKHKLGLGQHNLDVLSTENQELAHEAFEIYKNSLSFSLPQLLHNDAHDENIFLRNKEAAFIDFGDMIWRDVHYDFYNYVVKYPGHWNVIVDEFERLSGNKLNRQRIISISLLRYLRGFLFELRDPKEEKRILKKFEYFRKLLNKK